MSNSNLIIPNNNINLCFTHCYQMEDPKMGFLQEMFIIEQDNQDNQDKTIHANITGVVDNFNKDDIIKSFINCNKQDRAVLKEMLLQFLRFNYAKLNENVQNTILEILNTHSSIISSFFCNNTRSAIYFITWVFFAENPNAKTVDVDTLNTFAKHKSLNIVITNSDHGYIKEILNDNIHKTHYSNIVGIGYNPHRDENSLGTMLMANNNDQLTIVKYDVRRLFNNGDINERSIPCVENKGTNSKYHHIGKKLFAKPTDNENIDLPRKYKRVYEEADEFNKKYDHKIELLIERPLNTKNVKSSIPFVVAKTALNGEKTIQADTFLDEICNNQSLDNNQKLQITLKVFYKTLKASELIQNEVYKLLVGGFDNKLENIMLNLPENLNTMTYDNLTKYVENDMKISFIDQLDNLISSIDLLPMYTTRYFASEDFYYTAIDDRDLKKRFIYRISQVNIIMQLIYFIAQKNNSNSTLKIMEECKLDTSRTTLIKQQLHDCLKLIHNCREYNILQKYLNINVTSEDIDALITYKTYDKTRNNKDEFINAFNILFPEIPIDIGV